MTLLGSAAAAWPRGTRAQEAGRTYRLGFLVPPGRETPATATTSASWRPTASTTAAASSRGGRAFADWPPTLMSALKIRPTFSYGRFGYTIESELVDAILTDDGLTITNPKHAATVGIEMDDRILTVNGHRPAGGVFMAVLNMRRDPDSNTIQVQLDRRGTIMQRTLVLH